MILKTLSIPVILTAGFALVSGMAAAQESPANQPPASFDGREFVDNNGCIFVRAGINGSTTWVPRVTRDREPLCDQTPTFGGGAGGAIAAAAPNAENVLIGPVASASAAAPAAATGAAAQVARAPASKPAAAQPPRILRRMPGDTLGSSIVTCYACERSPYETVATPVVQPKPVKKIVKKKAKAVAVASRLPGNTWIVPTHVYKNKKAREGLHVPHGYMPAWSDDRLNPYRAYQKVDGFYATQKVWTNQVPRQLVAKARKHSVKDPLVNNRVTDKVPYANSYGHSYRMPMMSSRSAVAKAAKDVRWVEIGVFTTEAKAHNAAARLQSHGLVVKLGKVSRKGQTVNQLRVGPFQTHSALNAALAATHKAGYVSAYIK